MSLPTKLVLEDKIELHFSRLEQILEISSLEGLSNDDLARFRGKAMALRDAFGKELLARDIQVMA